MPNVASVLKAEIVRLARKEARSATGTLRDAYAALRKKSIAQARKIAALEREVRRVRPLARQAEAERMHPDTGTVESARISAAMVSRVRSRLGMTQAEFAELMGVSALSIYQWEHKDGPLRLRTATKTAFVAVRALGKREAQAQLEEKRAKAAAPKTKGRKAPRKRAKKK
jgi:DNA-binding XRE family transcriptional regulator